MTKRKKPGRRRIEPPTPYKLYFSDSGEWLQVGAYRRMEDAMSEDIAPRWRPVVRWRIDANTQGQWYGYGPHGTEAYYLITRDGD